MSSTTSTRSGESPSLSFTEFLERMKSPAAADLVRTIKNFIRDFETRHKAETLDSEMSSALVQQFLAQMDVSFREHPMWCNGPAEDLEKAAEGLEKYLMSKIWSKTFSGSHEDRDRDERYYRIAAALSFVDLQTLMAENVDIVPEPDLLSAAIEELRRMDKYKAPYDKLLCLVNTKTLVEDIVGSAVRSGANIGGADAFFPIFLLVVIKAQLHNLASNIEYIRRYRAKPRLSGQFDYMLANLESAAMYLDTVDWKHLKISQDEFLARLAEAGIPEAHLELISQRNSGHVLTPEVVPGNLKNAAQTDSQLYGLEESLARKNADDTISNEVVANLIDLEMEHKFQSDRNDESSDLHNKVVDALDTTQGKMDGNLLSPIADDTCKDVDISDEEAHLATVQDTPSTSKLTEPKSLLDQNGVEDQANDVLEPETTNDIVSPDSESALVGVLTNGVSVVMKEEASGRLLERYPWMYASAQDLTIRDVYSLLSAYRELALQHEVIIAALKEEDTKSGACSSNCIASSARDSSKKGNKATTSKILDLDNNWHEVAKDLLRRLSYDDAGDFAESSTVNDGNTMQNLDVRSMLLSLFGSSTRLQGK